MQDSVILFIDHYKIPCVGENIQLCYRIKVKDSEAQNFYGLIEGFHYKWGYTYMIEVEKIYLDHPRADEASFKYRLKKIIKMQKILTKETFELPVRMEGYSLIELKNGRCYYFGGQKIQTGRYSFTKLVHASSAIFSHGATDPHSLVLIKIINKEE